MGHKNKKNKTDTWETNIKETAKRIKHIRALLKSAITTLLAGVRSYEFGMVAQDAVRCSELNTELTILKTIERSEKNAKKELKVRKGE